MQSYDILTFSETWLDNSIRDDTVSLENFASPIRLDRNRHGGGVAIYIRNTIPHRRRTDLEINGLEAIWAAVSLSNNIIFTDNRTHHLIHGI